MFSMKYLKWTTDSIGGFWNVTIEIIFDVTKDPLVGDLSLDLEGVSSFVFKGISPNVTKGSFVRCSLREMILFKSFLNFRV